MSGKKKKHRSVCQLSIVNSQSAYKYNITDPFFNQINFYFTFLTGAAVFIIIVTVFCFVLPGVVIIASHAAILHQVRRAGHMFSNRATRGKQSSEAEIQLIRVLNVLL